MKSGHARWIVSLWLFCCGGAALADDLYLISGSRAVDEPVEFFVRAESTSNLQLYQVRVECQASASGYVTVDDAIIGRFDNQEVSHFPKDGLEAGIHRVALHLQQPGTCTAFSIGSNYFLFTEVPPDRHPLARLEVLAGEVEGIRADLASGNAMDDPAAIGTDLDRIEAELNALSSEPCCRALVQQLLSSIAELRDRITPVAFSEPHAIPMASAWPSSRA